MSGVKKRHPAGSSEGGRFKSAPAAEIAADAPPLSLSQGEAIQKPGLDPAEITASDDRDLRALAASYDGPPGDLDDWVDHVWDSGQRYDDLARRMRLCHLAARGHRLPG